MEWEDDNQVLGLVVRKMAGWRGVSGHAYSHFHLGEMDNDHPLVSEGGAVAQAGMAGQESKGAEWNWLPTCPLTCLLIQMPSHFWLHTTSWVGEQAALGPLHSEDEERERLGAGELPPAHHQARG